MYFRKLSSNIYLSDHVTPEYCISVLFDYANSIPAAMRDRREKGKQTHPHTPDRPVTNTNHTEILHITVPRREKRSHSSDANVPPGHLLHLLLCIHSGHSDRLAPKPVATLLSAPHCRFIHNEDRMKCTPLHCPVSPRMLTQPAADRSGHFGRFRR